ncbi:hypothetical protein BO70DRAFT_290488 [Aspergillus heteromorphus CBS 117.55]|uniref:DUF6594 domain-containing protein n=1 Tax=Aspergillus heteromorphus CBS 117.55 TaxID=1448321 RepID=A0A317W9Y7_9EURO|nr:uncharacterized protein BO70DRAFT_290488 [Aspergillus heteromorphus CBS 117.55]PWY83386.1 hypothetical protein BO70DRAFT_290488 [Aspergillus heteromorphus CBS 117.55]
MATENLRRLEGYDKLATFIAADPGLSFFRRFTKLNIKSLLYYQAEIAILENDLDFIIQDDKDSNDENKLNYPLSVLDLKESVKRAQEEHPTQWLKFQELRDLIEKYTTALSKTRDLMSFSTPDKCDLAVLRDWLDRPEGGDMFFESVTELNLYDPHNESDLIALFSRHEGIDNMTRWIFNRVIPWFHKRWGHNRPERRDIEMGAWRYDDRKIKSFTYIVSIVFAAVLPASSMIVLYYIKDTAIRMVMIMVYNVVFALALGLMVRARRVEIFATATA